MPSVGPIPPPAQMTKRKREAEDDDELKVVQKSTLSNSRSTSPSSAAKKTRTIGPTLPPANLDERPPQSPERDIDSSSDDDGFGPSLPTAISQMPGFPIDEPWMNGATDPQATAPTKIQRDEWMIVPPSSGDWSSRMDPTKLKNRKFNTGKGSKGAVQNADGESNVSWTETPNEKKARLQREMMGIKDISSGKESPQDDGKARAKAKKLREFNVSVVPSSPSLACRFDRSQEKSRGSTLYTEHQKTNPQEKEDDPSARAFDRDKDIAGGMKINHTQRRELMNKAADFGSRFSSGKFL